MSDAFEQVLLRLRQGERHLRKADIRALSDLNRQQMREFREVWAELPADIRLSTISTLAQIAQDSFEYCFDRIFREALNDPVPQIRRKAVEGLWECEEESVASTFLHMLQEDPDISVRSAVAVGLGRFVYLAEFEEIEPSLAAAIESALLTIIHNPNEPLELRRRAVESIGFSGNPEVQAVIRDAYEDEHPDMRMSAVIAMGRSADRHWGKIILRELMSEDRMMRHEAVRAAGELELQEATDLLARILDYEDDLDIRRDAVLALGKVGGKGAKAILEHIIASEDEDLFDVAQDAMEELTFGAQFPEINELLRLVEEEERRGAGDEEEADEWEDWDWEEDWEDEDEDDFLDEEDDRW